MSWTKIACLLSLTLVTLCQIGQGHSTVNKIDQEGDELVQAVIIFSGGITTPPKSDYSVNRNWIQRVGYRNLDSKGKEQMRQVGIEQRKAIHNYSALCEERDVAIYTQDMNNSIVSSYFFAQGFLTKPSQQSENKTNSTANSTVAESSKKIDEFETLKAFTFLDVPVVTNHYKYDPVLMPFGPTCPNLLMNQQRFKEQVAYRERSNHYSKFLSEFNRRIFVDTRITIDTLEQATVFEEYLTAEKAITGANEVSIKETDRETLEQIKSFYRYFEHFYDTQLKKSGVALLLQQIKKDFSEKSQLEFTIDSDKENLLRSNRDKTVTAYSVSETTLANLLLVMNVSSETCSTFNSNLTRPECLKWPGFGSNLRIELLRNKTTLDLSVKFFYQNQLISVNETGSIEGRSNLTKVFRLFDNYTLVGFNSYCGAEWLIGKRAVQTFMGLVFFNIIFIGLSVMLLIIIVFMKVKINSLKLAKELVDSDCNKIEEGVNSRKDERLN